MVERAAHNGFVVGSIPTRLKRLIFLNYNYKLRFLGDILLLQKSRVHGNSNQTGSLSVNKGATPFSANY